MKDLKAILESKSDKYPFYNIMYIEGTANHGIKLASIKNSTLVPIKTTKFDTYDECISLINELPNANTDGLSKEWQQNLLNKEQMVIVEFTKSDEYKIISVFEKGKEIKISDPTKN